MLFIFETYGKNILKIEYNFILPSYFAALEIELKNKFYYHMQMIFLRLLYFIWQENI